MKYHFPKNVSLLEQKQLQGAMMPGLVEALQITRTQGLAIHHFLWTGPDQISPLASLASVDGTRNKVLARNFLPESDIHSPAYISPEHLEEGRMNKGGMWGSF